MIENHNCVISRRRKPIPLKLLTYNKLSLFCQKKIIDTCHLKISLLANWSMIKRLKSQNSRNCSTWSTKILPLVRWRKIYRTNKILQRNLQWNMLPVNARRKIMTREQICSHCNSYLFPSATKSFHWKSTRPWTLVSQF